MENSFETLCAEVERIRQNQGDEKRSLRVPRDLQKKALHFFKHGVSVGEICSGLKISEKTFSYWRSRHGLSLKANRSSFREVVLSAPEVGLRLQTAGGHQVFGLTLSDVKALMAEQLI